MADSPPRISVLMAVHNARNYLDRCVRSIVGQTEPDFEFIIVDDGSTDGSGRLLARWQGRDARIRLVSRENRGLTRSLNEALSLARGEYIARMDADDVSLPTRFALQIGYLSTHPACVAVGGEVMMTDAEGWPIGRRGHARTHEEIDRRLWRADGGALTHPAVMMRAESLRKIGGYREQFTTAQDLDLYLRLAEEGELANLPDTVLLWRQHRQSVNATRRHTWADMIRMALQDSAKRRGVAADVDSIMARIPTSTVPARLEWGAYASKSGHPWTALKNGCLSFVFERHRREARQLIADAGGHLWSGFRTRLSSRFRIRRDITGAPK